MNNQPITRGNPVNRGGRNWDSCRGYTSRHQDDNESDHERTNAGPPPTFDGTTDFKDYKIRARLWLSTPKSKPRTRGPLLLKNLSGSAFDNFKWLANDDSWLNASDNGETLLAKMNTREYYGEDSREDMLNCLGRLAYQLKRSDGGESCRGTSALALRSQCERSVTMEFSFRPNTSASSSSCPFS